MLALCAVAGVERAAVAEGTSNPPFLGITMGGRTGAPGVIVEGVTPGTAAERAGLQPNDLIMGMDGQPLPDLQASTQNPTARSAVEVLIDRITEHAVGDEITLRVLRGSHARDITAVLSSRTDVMQQHVVGKQLDVPVVDVDDSDGRELGDLVGRTTVIGWSFREGSNRCSDCMRVLDRIDQRIRKLALPDVPRLVAVTNDTDENIRRDRQLIGSSLEVMHASTGDIEQTLAFADPRRLSITITDCRGIARFVAVILPGADDEDAVIDEIVAAVEQQTAAHSSRPRR